MVWKVPPLRLLLLALIPLIPLSFAAAQEDPAAPAAAAPAEDPATAELDAFYDERLRTAPPKVKQLLDRLQAQSTATMTYRMGYTTALDRSLQELTGAKPGPSADVLKPQMDRAKQVMSRYREMREAQRLPAPGAACNPAANKFSWRSFKAVTPIKDQGQCGACWAFSAAAAFESSNALLNNKAADVSEQDLLDCSAETNCIGNWVQNAFDQLVGAGAAGERKRPYRGEVAQCATNVQRPYRAIVWAPLDADWSRVMSPAEIKAALCENGPIVAHIYATPSFLAYTSGVYSGLEPVTHESEGYHAILITGWDENQQAWEIKNSWGTGWGTRGFGKVQYGANLIGHHLLAILAAQDALGREEISSLREAGASPAAPVSGEAAPAE